MKKGWISKPLADLCEVFTDGNWIESKDQSPKGIRLIQTGNVGQGVFKDRGEKARYISEATFKRLRCTEIFEGDCLVSRLPDPVGRSCILPDTGERMITAVDCSILRFNRKEMLSTFFNFYSQSSDYLKAVEDVTTGTTRNRISRSNLGSVPIPVPPLPEQHRIVHLLDEAFEGIATAKANAAKNLQNARALFESHLQSVFSQQGKGWVEKTLGDTCEMYQPKTIGTKDLVPNGPYPVFGANGIIGRYDKFNHEEPQLLITCRGATCGSVNISQPKSWITGNAMVVRPKDYQLNLHFLEFFFRGGIDISVAITGAAQPQITRTNLSPLLICYPESVREQMQLAKQFEDLTTETQRLASLYTRKLAALEALKKSLLHQAFSGEL
jgi:type I restriction enzyme, S subunit